VPRPTQRPSVASAAPHRCLAGRVKLAPNPNPRRRLLRPEDPSRPCAPARNCSARSERVRKPQLIRPPQELSCSVHRKQTRRVRERAAQELRCSHRRSLRRSLAQRRLRRIQTPSKQNPWPRSPRRRGTGRRSSELRPLPRCVRNQPRSAPRRSGSARSNCNPMILSEATPCTSPVPPRRREKFPPRHFRREPPRHSSA
jgi:hypothetical protein